MIRPLRLALAALLVPASIAACGGGQGTSTTTAGTGGTGAGTTTTPSTGGGGGAGGAGGGIHFGECSPPCVDPQICSKAGMCIDAGTCVVDDDCGAGLVCDMTSHACVPGGMCGTMTTSVAPVAPNLLIVLDRSCSMTAKVGTQPKWTIAVNAIDKMTSDFAGKIRFGLTMFPDLATPNCDQGAIPIPVAPGNEMAIQTMLNASLMASDPNYPDGPCVTPIDAGMHQASTETAFTDTSRASYVLLVTDGAQSSGCTTYGANAGTKMIITDLYQNKKVATFVLGFGGAVDTTHLNQFADAGGVPSGNATKHYYDAADAMSLEAVLTAIATKTLSCSFALADTPPDPAKVLVFLDKNQTPLPRDPTHMMGWDYDGTTNQVTFYGATCDMLKSGMVSDVSVVFGCGGMQG